MHDKSYFKEESGREAQEGGDICVCVCVCVCIYIAGSCRCTAETNTTL